MTLPYCVGSFQTGFVGLPRMIAARQAEVEVKAQMRTVRSSLSLNLNLSLLGFHPSCKVDIHLLFFAAPSDSRNIYRSSSKESLWPA